MSSRQVCNVCSKGLELRGITVEAGSGDVGVVIDQAPYLACEDGHYRLDPSPGFDDTVVESVVDGVPIGIGTRWPWRAVRCASCGTDLVMPPRRTHRSVTVVSDATPPVTVTLDVPLVRCTECGVDQLPPDLEGDVAKAVRLALVRRGTTAG